MKTFKIKENLEIVCEYKKTRSGFKHTASLIQSGKEIESVKCTYLNRTWERYEFESVLNKLADKSAYLSDTERQSLKDKIQNEFKEQVSQMFKTIGLVASLGDVFGKDQKQSNDWKARMLKAGLEPKGLSIPDDWDSLTEDEKTKRLDGVIKIMNE